MWWCTLALAQSPSDDWKTIRTEHFRVHYPADAAAWAETAAGRIEAIHARVVDEVGYLPPRVIDVVVRDPYGTANGMALAFLGAPRMELWTSPPEATSVIGERRSWDELLLVHEDAHLVHLVRPSRNPVTGTVDAILGWGPILRKSPAWVIEGYATVVEGRLTGSGRPNGSFRTALLRALGRDGRMPAYWELNWNGRYLGGSYRYLVGSAFLEWLEAEVGPEVGASEHPLRDLWARMSARKIRSFDEAFRGVFRDSPQVLYDRFRAEVEADAVAEPTGQTWVFLEHGWGLSRPTVNADGTRIAAVVERRGKRPSLVVWDTAFDREAEAEWEEAVAKRLAKDPDDVGPVRPWAFPPREIARTSRRIGAFNEPVFEPSGAIVYTAWTWAPDLRMRPDLFRWDPEEVGVRRLTRGADLRAPDVAPDGTWIAAVRSRWGITEIVRVDPATGAVTQRVAPEPGVDVDGPRIGPDGRLAWLENRGDGWHAVLDGVGRIDVRGVTDLAWSGEALIGVCAEPTGLDVCRVWPDAAALTTHGAVLAADATPERLYFAALDGEGTDLRTFAPVERPLSPRPAVDGPPAIAPVAVDPRAYGAGPLDATPLFAGAFSVRANTSEYGFRLGDPVGRWELLALGALGDATGISGGGVQATWRGVRPELLASGWVTSGSSALGPEWVGGAWAGARAETRAPAAGLAAEVGAATERRLDGAVSASFATAEVAWGALEPRRAALGVLGAFRAQGGFAGDTFALGAADATVSIGRAWGLDLAYGAGISSGPRRFSLGGVDTGVVAPAARWSILVAPAFDPELMIGRLYDRSEVAAITPWVALFADRWRVADTLGPHGATVAGLRVDGSLTRQPLARFPAFESEFGVGIRLEDPAAGWLRRVPVWGDLAAWGALRWAL